ncbi:hypothetical protein GCM10009091_02190 [Pseudomonas brenneri]|nr:hypothetical protein GCM10009091_02190 [Pseudomonas brenneri]
MPTGETAAHQLDTTDFNDPVTIGHRHAGGFGIEYNRSDGHQGSALNGSVHFKGRDISTLYNRSDPWQKPMGAHPTVFYKV